MIANFSAEEETQTAEDHHATQKRDEVGILPGYTALARTLQSGSAASPLIPGLAIGTAS